MPIVPTKTVKLVAKVTAQPIRPTWDIHVLFVLALNIVHPLRWKDESKNMFHTKPTTITIIMPKVFKHVNVPINVIVAITKCNQALEQHVFK